MLLAVASLSVTALILNSLLSSLTAISKVALLLDPSVLVAVTSICMVDADSKSNPLGSATVTSPVAASMAKALLGLLVKL